jgi:hypothetical protein
MRFILGLLSGLIGMLAGWFGLAVLVATLAGPDRDGGTAMGAFFDIGPVGGLVGLVAGIWLFNKKGMVRDDAPLPATEASGAAARPRTGLSYPYAVSLAVLAAGVAWWTWYELIRSPYLTHGFMTLELQFRLPPGVNLPADKADVHIDVEEGQGHALVGLGERWREHDGDRQVILATASLMYKTSRGVVSLTLPDAPTETWRLNFGSDPDPMQGYTAWRPPDGRPAAKVEMNFRLSASR